MRELWQRQAEVHNLVPRIRRLEDCLRERHGAEWLSVSGRHNARGETDFSCLGDHSRLTAALRARCRSISPTPQAPANATIGDDADTSTTWPVLDVCTPFYSPPRDVGRFLWGDAADDTTIIANSLAPDCGEAEFRSNRNSPAGELIAENRRLRTEAEALRRVVEAARNPRGGRREQFQAGDADSGQVQCRMRQQVRETRELVARSQRDIEETTEWLQRERHDRHACVQRLLAAEGASDATAFVPQISLPR